MLNAIGHGLLKERGYELREVAPLGKNWLARAVKGTYRAEALGSSPEDATRKLVQVVVRP